MQFAFLILACCICTSAQQLLQVSFEDDIVALPDVGGGRWTFPLSCNENCRYIEWYRTSVNEKDVMHYSIRSNDITADYISMAISLNTDMFGNDDTYICARTLPGSSEFEIREGYTTEEVEPIIVEQRELLDFNISLDEDNFFCEFSRPLIVNRNVSGLNVSWNVMDTNFNLLFAEGLENESGDVRMHRYRTHTHGAFNHTENNGYHQQPPTQAPPTDTTTSAATKLCYKWSLLTAAAAIFCGVV